MKVVCGECGRIYGESYHGWKCECGGALWSNDEISFCGEDIKEKEWSMWRYDKAFPVKKKEAAATFGEGMTPFLPLLWNDRQIWVKNESLMPTGSFKDRGVAVMINDLHRRGVKKVTEDSSGNAGASVAAYCALAGIECSIYIPQGTSLGKVAQAECFGARLHQVAGTRDDTAEAAQKAGGDSVYAGHNWHPAFIEGVKSIAYEIWEQNHFKAPDYIVCPIGNGSLAAGIFLGFSELMRGGEIDVLPAIYGIEAENCNTIYREFEHLSWDYEVKPTVAEGIALYRPTRTRKIAEMIRKTNGKVITVSEEEIKDALREITGKGYFIEPTSAAAFAGMTKLIREQIIDQDSQAVVIISGNGLKASAKIQEILKSDTGENS